MKKIIWFLILLLPFYVFAYSDYIISGGDTLGIEVNGKGLVVVGFYDVDGSKINRFLQVGDRILEVNDITIKYAEEKNKALYENDEKLQRDLQKAVNKNKLDEIYEQMKYDIERELLLLINKEKTKSGNIEEGLSYMPKECYSVFRLLAYGKYSK